MSTLIKDTQIITMGPAGIVHGDIVVEGNRLFQVGGTATGEFAKVIQGHGLVALPGLVQVHVHLAQAIFRGMADDLDLLPWLAQRIWPLEAAHDPDSIYWSALLGMAELFQGGTTCIADMETAHHTQVALEAIASAGIRAVTGKVLMDQIPPGWPSAGPGAAAAKVLVRPGALEEAAALGENWHGAAGGRISYALCPRFALSCSQRLLREAAALARDRNYLFHTHAAEARDEVALIRETHGMGNIEYLDFLGLLGKRTLLAHCIHLAEGEEDILARTGTKIAHCPSANLKLGSGVAPVSRLRAKGIPVGLGADGAPCNNNLDAFTELRLCALLQKEKEGPTALPALEALRMATLEGARCLGLEDEIGSLEVGKKADLILVDLNGPHCLPVQDPVGTLVYAAKSGDVRLTMVDGRVVMEAGRLTTIDGEALGREVQRSARSLRQRAGLG